MSIFFRENICLEARCEIVLDRLDFLIWDFFMSFLMKMSAEYILAFKQ